jgi:hypothetical protein
MEYRYDINQFKWNKDENTFFAEAYFLECIMPDGNIHPEAFPNQKQQFFIDNGKTGGFRRFRFLKEELLDVLDENNEIGYTIENWIFESEDGIKCSISIN